MENQDYPSKNAFLAYVRHELRTPLNVIIGYSEMLLEDATEPCPEHFISDLRKIHTSGKQLLAVLNDLIEPSKNESDIETLERQVRHALRTPLNSIIGYSEMLLEEVEDIGKGNLVPELQKIRTAGKRLLAFIDDIDNLSETRAGTMGRTPKGYSTVREVVTALRPQVEDKARASKVECGFILVVDDDEMSRDMLCRRLERQGHTVAVAENGRRALEILKTQKFDLVLLDMMMPEMNGDEALERLKTDHALRHIPVIMLSALDEIGSVVRCIEIGAEDYIPKPFNPVLLRARISACLEKKRLSDREVAYLQQIEEEKKRSDELLHVILPHEIVEELKATNEVKPRRYENVAVLFCDIVGFTSYCDTRQPEEVISHLQELTESFEGIALHHDLEKIKTIGDAFMATAGLLKPVENPVLNCVRCGLEMVSIALRLSGRWQVRVGIHVGPVIAGVMGRSTYLFDVWGDTVNTAARLESNGVVGAVNVSGAAWQQIAGLCRGESLGLVKIKGKGSLEMFRVDRET